MARSRAVEAVYATGTVEPLHTVVVRARISEHVGTILVEAGDVVTAGQLLARIENPVREFALARGKCCFKAITAACDSCVTRLTR